MYDVLASEPGATNRHRQVRGYVHLMSMLGCTNTVRRNVHMQWSLECSFFVMKVVLYADVERLYNAVGGL